MRTNLIVTSIAILIVAGLVIRLQWVQNKLISCNYSNMQLQNLLDNQNAKVKAFENKSSKQQLQKTENKVVTKYEYIKLKDNSCQGVLDTYLKLLKD